MTKKEKFDPIEEFIGHQLHSVSGVDAGMMPKKPKGKGGEKPWRWWPYPNNKQTKSFHTSSYEDRLIGAIDKKRKMRNRSRQDEVEDLLSKGYRKKEVAEIIGVSRRTVSRDITTLRKKPEYTGSRMRLAWEKSKK